VQFFVLGIDGPDFGVDDDLNEVHWAYMDRSADALVARGPTRSVDGGHHTGSVHVIELPNALRAAQYTAVPASKGGATPMAFPSGCGLYVYVYKWNNASVGSSLTSCTYAVNYIQHDSNLYRLDWWGWDLRAQGERTTPRASRWTSRTTAPTRTTTPGRT